MSEEHIKVSRDGAVLEIRFNRPAKKNAITNAMYGAMADALESGAADKGVRAILFTAEGDFFTLPPWAWHAHANASTTDPAILFQINDQPALETLALYREMQSAE